MIQDEEQMSAEAARLPPQQPQAQTFVEGQDPEQAAESGRQASPREQKMFEVMARQILAALASEKSADAILAMAQAQGPGKAIGTAAGQALDAVAGAAQAAGVEIGPEVRAAAAQPVVVLLAKAMGEAGMGDPKQIAAEAMQMIEGG
jgi:hypothetical protein